MCIQCFSNYVESKKKVKKTYVPVQEMIYGALLAEELQKMCEIEFEMALQDRIMEETKDKNNALEAYDYEMRNKVVFIIIFTYRIYSDNIDGGLKRLFEFILQLKHIFFLKLRS